ncbi:MAG: SRPBCC family protein [Pseudomonadota bacterium]
MKMRILTALVLAALTAACAAQDAPTEPVAWVDPPEILSDESDYVISAATATVPLSPEELRAYLAENGSLIAFMEPVGSIAPPVDSQAIRGTWPDEGSRRRLIQVDGHQILERSLKNEVTDFRYQAFALTSGAGWAVDHIYADWSLTPVEGGTRFDWTYRVAPKYGILRVFMNRMRDNELHPFMQGAMDRMAAAVRTEQQTVSASSQ